MNTILVRSYQSTLRLILKCIWRLGYYILDLHLMVLQCCTPFMCRLYKEIEFIRWNKCYYDRVSNSFPFFSRDIKFIQVRSSHTWESEWIMSYFQHKQQINKHLVYICAYKSPYNIHFYHFISHWYCFMIELQNFIFSHQQCRRYSTLHTSLNSIGWLLIWVNILENEEKSHRWSNVYFNPKLIRIRLMLKKRKDIWYDDKAVRKLRLYWILP